MEDWGRDLDLWFLFLRGEEALWMVLPCVEWVCCWWGLRKSCLFVMDGFIECILWMDGATLSICHFYLFLMTTLLYDLIYYFFGKIER